MSETRHLSWGAEALWRQLNPLLPGLSVEVVARVESTNTQLLERVRRDNGRRATQLARPGEIDPRSLAEAEGRQGRRSGDTQPCLLVAEHQTRGRGRLGRDWYSTPGASLTFSLALPFAPKDWSGLSLAVGVALAEAIDLTAVDGSPRVGLKWPNDLWLLDSDGGGRKLGGVLIETMAIGERRMCVVGIGLNVLPQALDGLSSGYACLNELDPQVTAPRLLARVSAPLVRALQRFEVEGFEAFAQAYRARDLLFGRSVTTTASDCPAGIADGVDDDGALRVQADRMHHLVSGEVSVRLHPDGGARAAEPGAC